MRVLRRGMLGEDVGRWQAFLRGRGAFLEVTDAFDVETVQATCAFQKMYGLRADGVVGPDTYSRAMNAGFDPTLDDDDDKYGPNWPPPPSFKPLVSDAERAQTFGSFSYKSANDPRDPERILVTDDWYKQNIILVEVPQLKDVTGMRGVHVPFHQAAAGQLERLFSAWESAGLLSHVRSWAGSYAPRFVRGSRTRLSNHAFGTAFDINVAWNGLGVQPALVGKTGSVRELVPVANEHGFYWGGHFSRKDGMHFEVAVLV